MHTSLRNRFTPAVAAAVLLVIGLTGCSGGSEGSGGGLSLGTTTYGEAEADGITVVATDGGERPATESIYFAEGDPVCLIDVEVTNDTDAELAVRGTLVSSGDDGTDVVDAGNSFEMKDGEEMGVGDGVIKVGETATYLNAVICEVPEGVTPELQVSVVGHDNITVPLKL